MNKVRVNDALLQSRMEELRKYEPFGGISVVFRSININRSRQYTLSFLPVHVKPLEFAFDYLIQK
jgi:hypothetical protein